MPKEGEIRWKRQEQVMSRGEWFTPPPVLQQFNGTSWGDVPTVHWDETDYPRFETDE